MDRRSLEKFFPEFGNGSRKRNFGRKFHFVLGEYESIGGRLRNFFRNLGMDQRNEISVENSTLY